MGFIRANHKNEVWFDHFRQRQNCGALDVILLQETHVTTGASAAVQQVWSFNVDTGDRVLSLWGEAELPQGRVAMLLSPYSSISSLTPYKPDLWTAHWMAAIVEIHGAAVLVINCYAPSSYASREAFYASLLDIDWSHDGPVLVVGDFNCALNDRIDRTYHDTDTKHDSPERRKLLEVWSTSDVLEDAGRQAMERHSTAQFARAHHTYYYSVSGNVASSRLDRWYCSTGHEDWIRNVSSSIAVQYSDHNGVSIRVTPSDRVVQCKKAQISIS